MSPGISAFSLDNRREIALAYAPKSSKQQIKLMQKRFSNQRQTPDLPNLRFRASVSFNATET